MARPSTHTQEIDSTVYIYGLYDVKGDLRYIGKANCVNKRLASHMRDSRRRKTPVYAWIRKNGEPEIRVLESCTQRTWGEVEKRLIKEARERGDKLLNVAEGGDQPFCPAEVRSENGKRLVRRHKGLEPWPDEMVTREALIKDALNWIYNFAIKVGNLPLAAKTELKRREYYREDPVAFKCWKRA